MATKRPRRSAHRGSIPASVALEVLTEAGYRCAVPTCRGILAIDLHHMVPVRDAGPNTAANLLALCPTCHALYERGYWATESIFAWKAFLTSLVRAFDHHTLDLAWFLQRVPGFRCSADGAIAFARLIGAGLADYREVARDRYEVLVQVSLSKRGRELLNAWMAADMRPLVGIDSRAGRSNKRLQAAKLRPTTKRLPTRKK